jgi:hypothetical protein
MELILVLVQLGMELMLEMILVVKTAELDEDGQLVF